MALNLQQFISGYTGAEAPIYGYRDQFGQTWRQGGSWNDGQLIPNGAWERLTGQETDYQGLSQGVWSADDPFSSRWTTGLTGLDPYQQYLQYVQNSGDVGLAGTQQEIGSSGYLSYVPSQDWLQDPVGLFDTGYNQGNRRSVNPYFSTQIRDVMRGVAGKLGLTAADADKAALNFAQQHLAELGQVYSEASHGALVADAVAQSLFQQAGRQYQALTPEQRTHYSNLALQRQHALRDSDQDSWKRDQVGGALAFIPEVMQSNWEAALENPERLALGAWDPLGTGLWNKILGEEWDPVVNEVGGPGKGAYEDASNQGIETGLASGIQWMVDNALKIYGGGQATAGVSQGMASSGIDPAYAPAATGAAQGAVGSISNPNADWTDVLEASLKGAALSGGGQAAGAAGGETVGNIASGATTAYKLSQAYENDNYAGLATTAAGATGNFFKTGFGSSGNDADFDLTKGDLTSNSNSDLDLLSNKRTDEMSLTDGYFDDYTGQWVTGDVPSGGINSGSADDWMLSNNGNTYQSNDYAQMFGGGGGYNYGTGGNTATGTSLGGLGSFLGGLGSGTGSGNTNYGQLLGGLGAAGLGYMGSKEQAEAYERLANQYMGMGAPYRARLESLYQNPQAYLTSPEVTASVDQGTNALARALSVQGNPAGNATALQGLQSYATNTLYGQLANEKQRLANFGGLSQLTGAAPGASMAGINAGRGAYDAMGYGLNAALNPQPNMMDIIKQLQQGGGLA